MHAASNKEFQLQAKAYSLLWVRLVLLKTFATNQVVDTLARKELHKQMSNLAWLENVLKSASALKSCPLTSHLKSLRSSPAATIIPQSGCCQATWGPYIYLKAWSQLSPMLQIILQKLYLDYILLLHRDLVLSGSFLWSPNTSVWENQWDPSWLFKW